MYSFTFLVEDQLKADNFPFHILILVSSALLETVTFTSLKMLFTFMLLSK